MITDMQLHAFVDRQLDSAEQARVLAEAARSPELAARLAELQRLKHLVECAYATGVCAGDRASPDRSVFAGRR